MSDAQPAVGSQRNLLDETFGVSLVLKGLDGLVEVVGGVLLLTVSAARLNDWAARFARSELSQDRRDFVSRHLLHLTANLQHTRLFGAAYLLSHGIVKIVLVAAVLRKKHWAYPWMIAFLVLFIVYQCYRMIVAPSLGLALLTIFDALVVALTWREYRLHARGRGGLQAV